MEPCGTGPFSGDGALNFLADLADQPPERRAAALERVFRSATEQLGRDVSADEVVAAAAIVAATLLGGRQFAERLDTLAGNDDGPDARLSAPAPELAGIAHEALLLVGDRTDDTVAALSQVLTLGGHPMDDLDIVWNEAADHGADGEVPDGTPSGVGHLASLLRVHNSVMGGGLGFALEVNEPFRVRRAVDAMRYFDLVEAADLLDDALNRHLKGEPPESPPSDDDYYDLVDDDTARAAFETKAARVPADFGR